MENKSVNNRSLSGWLEDFIIGLSKKTANNDEVNNENAETQENNDNDNDNKEEEDIVVAKVNINDLDEVVWKDETFRVHFDGQGANVINQFGNVVTSVANVNTIEEVDKKLNGNDIVVSSTHENEEENLEQEINKIANSLEDQELSEDSDLNEEVVASNEDNEEDETITAIINGIDELEHIIANVEERLNKKIALVEQQYARNPQLEEVSDNSPEEEVKHFTETADETAQSISNENQTDMTTPAGRVELSQHQNEPSDIQEMVTNVTDEQAESDKQIDLEKENIQEEDVEKESNVIEEDSEAAEIEEFQKLSGKDEKIFQNGICPSTGERLVKAKKSGNFLGVYSPEGGTEYAVNLNTGEIHKYNK